MLNITYNVSGGLWHGGAKTVGHMTWDICTSFQCKKKNVQVKNNLKWRKKYLFPYYKINEQRKVIFYSAFVKCPRILQYFSQKKSFVDIENSLILALNVAQCVDQNHIVNPGRLSKETYFVKFQVYAWGDNDHGQQGNGTTTVNRKPALVHGLEGYKITRVACGSSHSISWATTDLSVPTSHEPVLFSTSRDPLGVTMLGNILHVNEISNI